MTRRDFILLSLLGFIVYFGIAQFQRLPGYMDADYYFGGGLQLAHGNGFNEPYIWNYLADPQTLPTPSHAYWLPLASIVAAAGMWLSGQATYAAARFGFVLLAALVPPMTATLAYRLTSNRVPSLLSGLLACFSIFYAPFLPATDNFAIYMLIGASFFILITDRISPRTFFLFGLLSALASLARSDGLLWLGMSFLVAFWWAGRQAHTYTGAQVGTEPEAQNISSRSEAERTHPVAPNSHRPSPISHLPTRSFILHLSSFILATLLGFLLLASPWYARNLSTFGALMAPGGSRALWLTSYADTFDYPASQLTMQSWLASGWDAILKARLNAMFSLKSGNLLNAFGAQGGVFLFPFILIGLWKLRRDMRVRLASLAWLLLLLVMSFVFPFAGPRGAFFHAGAALQPMWWSLAPLGLDALIAFARGKNLFDDRAYSIFRVALVVICLLMTGFIFTLRFPSGWEREDGHYAAVERILVQHNAPGDAIVMARNPPGYNVVTGRFAIAIPNGGIPAILAVAEQFDARYLILEKGITSTDLKGLYDHPDQSSSFLYLGESDGNRIFQILR